jgi:hypothetical protein
VIAARRSESPVIRPLTYSIGTGHHESREVKPSLGQDYGKLHVAAVRTAGNAGNTSARRSGPLILDLPAENDSAFKVLLPSRT